MLAQSLKFLPVSRPRKSRQAASRLIGWGFDSRLSKGLILEHRIKRSLIDNQTCAPSTYFSIKLLGFDSRRFDIDSGVRRWAFIGEVVLD